ncbi:MAG: phospho-N-acetylmuramoyl-pentapeptide-transferase [Candidatus Hydrogenedentota bacterium]
MLYYLADYFSDSVSALNIFRYHTVRAGGALFTGFIVSVLIGPWVLGWLRALKVGQFIKKDHVQDLHDLHKGKAGTPTMGGMLIILATLASLALWSTLTNPLLLIATGVLVAMGAVGFLDDYIKLRRKHNDGLSTRAKFSGQILVGLVLGTVLVMNPVTLGNTYLNKADVEDWPGFAIALIGAERNDESPLYPFVSQFPGTIEIIMQSDDGAEIQGGLLSLLNASLLNTSVHEAAVWDSIELPAEAQGYIDKGVLSLGAMELVRMNRLLLESASPNFMAASPQNMHTQVAVPGVKNLLIPFGILYIPFVIFILVATSNGVNLTDGLDGLAVGASIISLSAFTALAYVVSRADWSSYLFITHIPQASELTVFGAALLGTGLGFLWFNAHPAEVFMGDTGSLALGGVIATMAILTKQELLLPIVGGLFVLETLSVIIQVGSFKLRKKRVFRMAPLHHHFELLGWSETKVTIRFWIVAFLFALLSLATLKLR